MSPCRGWGITPRAWLPGDLDKLGRSKSLLYRRGRNVVSLSPNGRFLIIMRPTWQIAGDPVRLVLAVFAYSLGEERRGCCSDCNLAENRCASEIRSTSSAMESTAASMRSRRPLMELSSRGGTGFGSSQRVMSRTSGNPRTMMTIPGITHCKTVSTIRFGSGGICFPVRACR
jgi:hypothetical protein